jgi:uncharacterized damage-inducible protein DinB
MSPKHLSYNVQTYHKMKRVCIFITVAFCSLCCHANAQSIDSLFVHAAYMKLNGAAKYTLGVAELMPAESYSFKPSGDQMSFGQQLLHISRNLGWLSSYYLNNQQPNPVTEADLKLVQKDSIIVVVSRSYAYALNALNHFSPERLNDTVSFFAGPMTKLQIINLLNDHQTHHRGQLIVYLRLSAIRPPAYTGW